MRAASAAGAAAPFPAAAPAAGAARGTLRDRMARRDAAAPPAGRPQQADAAAGAEAIATTQSAGVANGGPLELPEAVAGAGRHPAVPQALRDRVLASVKTEVDAKVEVDSTIPVRHGAGTPGHVHAAMGGVESASRSARVVGTDALDDAAPRSSAGPASSKAARAALASPEPAAAAQQQQGGSRLQVFRKQVTDPPLAQAHLTKALMDMASAATVHDEPFVDRPAEVAFKEQKAAAKLLKVIIPELLAQGVGVSKFTALGDQPSDRVRFESLLAKVTANGGTGGTKTDSARLFLADMDQLALDLAEKSAPGEVLGTAARDE